MDTRFILYHKQSTSARTRFVKFPYDSVIAPDAIPMPAKLLETPPAESLPLDSASELRSLEDRIGLTPDCLEAEAEYRERVEIPGSIIQILLARISTTDPPFDLIEKAGASFIDLTQARGLPVIDLELLRKAYEVIMGG